MFQPATSRRRHRDTSSTQTGALALSGSQRQNIVQQACAIVRVKSTKVATRRAAARSQSSSWACLLAWASSYLASFPSHHTSRRREPTYSSSRSLSLSAHTYTYLYPSSILGHAPWHTLSCPPPACLNFPYLCQLHNSHPLPGSSSWSLVGAKSIARLALLDTRTAKG